jgi:uncharacterized membrane protein YphA (DoxX/SURF4 family)
MNTVLRVLQALLAAFFLAAGAFHLLMPLPRLKAGAPWTEDVGGPMVRLIGLLEVLAAIGLVLPGITHVATVLTPLAAIGAVLIFLGAIALHVRRGDVKVIGMHIVVIALAVVVIWGRLGPYSLS